MEDVNLKPADRISAVIKNIKKAPSSSFEKIIPAIYYGSKIFFRCKMFCKKQSQPHMGSVVWYDPVVGIFDAITDEEIVCFGHFENNMLALTKNKQFCLLTDYAWKNASIPSLPVDDIHHPVILTYQSLLIVINGSVVWVHDDSLCGWMQFKLSFKGTNFEISPKNSFAILAGKLFVCFSSQETVYSVELQQVIDIMLMEDALKDDETPKANNREVHPKWTLQLNPILKGATFVFRHDGSLLAFHNTPSSIDRVWYYDVQCYHWHDVEYHSSDASSMMLKTWISLSSGAGILELVWSTWSWGQAKLYEIQLVK